MKRKIIRGVALLLCVAMSLSACVGGESIDAYRLPEWALTIATPKATEDIDTILSSAKVDVYYDNTWSMYGFVREGQGNVIRMANALRDVLNQYNNSTFYTLDSVDGISQWVPYNGDWRNDFAKQEFYTYGSTRGDFKDGTGPLQMLYYEENTLDPTAINVIVTDLAEQNVDLSDLASQINKNIIAQDGYSAALIGMMGDFNGQKYISDLDTVDSMSGETVNGKSPLYILMTGPDQMLSSYLNNLETALASYQMEKDSTYYLARYQAGNSAKVLDFSEIQTADPAQEKDGMKKKDWATAEINQNLSLKEVDSAHQDTVIDTDKILNMYVYEYDSEANEVNPKRITLNYYVPIERTDGLSLPIEYKIYDEDETPSAVEIQELYSAKDTIRYSEAVVSEKGESEDDFKEENPEVTDIYSVSTSTEEEESVFAGWNEINKITRDKDLTIKYEIVSQGTPIYDMVLKDDGKERDEEDLEPQNLGYADNSNILHIQVEFSYEPEKRESDTILLSIPIYAMAQKVENIPEWVEQWDSSNASGDMIYHTFGLANFFRTLFGLNVTGDADYDRALHEVKVTDILTCVTGLPTA